MSDSDSNSRFSAQGNSDLVSDVALWRRRWPLSLLVLLAFAPLWWNYLKWCLQHGHYQYFPLLLFVVAVAYRSRFPDAKLLAAVPKRRFVYLGILISGSLLLVGNLLQSGWVGIVSTVFAAWWLTYARVGWRGLRVMSPVLALLFFAIPLPLGWDQVLILKMQFVASHAASLLLDGAGIMHVRDGIVLITEKSQYMTEEACSGVRSLFSSLAVVAIVSVLSRHRLARVGFNLFQTVIWVLIGNAVRVALTVYLADNVSPWFASGTGHEALSMLVFGGILLMTFSTDSTLGPIIGYHFRFDRTYDDEPYDLKQARAKKKTEPHAVLAPISQPPRTVTPTGASEPLGTLETALETSGVPETSEPSGTVVAREFSVSPLWVQRAPNWAIGTLVVWLLVTITVGWMATFGRSSFTLQDVDRLPAPTKDMLPTQLLGWKQVHYEHIHRKPTPLLAQDSYQWIFQRDSLRAVISVDCPWGAWHNLNTCYTATGWNTVAKYFIEPSPGMSSSQLTHSELEMSKPARRRGLVLFTVVDRNRDDVRDLTVKRDNLQHLFAKLMSRVKASIGLGDSTLVEALPATTIQLFSDQSSAFTDTDHQSLRELFFVVRAKLLDGKRWQKEYLSSAPQGGELRQESSQEVFVSVDVPGRIPAASKESLE